jgi:hypothetical protein
VPNKTRTRAKLERVNLMLSPADSGWLDELAAEIRTRTGAKLSRSEITRAAIATMRELHRYGDTLRFGALAACKSETELSIAGVLAVRSGRTAQRSTPTHTHTSPSMEDSALEMGNFAAGEQLTERDECGS